MNSPPKKTIIYHIITVPVSFRLREIHWTSRKSSCVSNSELTSPTPLEMLLTQRHLFQLATSLNQPDHFFERSSFSFTAWSTSPTEAVQDWKDSDSHNAISKFQGLKRKRYNEICRSWFEQISYKPSHVHRIQLHTTMPHMYFFNRGLGWQDEANTSPISIKKLDRLYSTMQMISFWALQSWLKERSIMYKHLQLHTQVYR